MLAMTDAKITVEGRTFSSPTGATLMECLVAEGLLLRSDCGGRGRCGKCLVQVSDPTGEGLSKPDEAEERVLGAGEWAAGCRLACRARVLGSVALEIPEESRLTQDVVQKGLPILLSRLESLSKVLRPAVTDAWGVAVDIGTTTIAVYLCDLGRAVVIASTSVRNPQSVFGDDVISRLSAVCLEQSALPRLQKMAVSAVDWATLVLCRQVGIDPQSIAEIVCVGNSVMLHLFLGEDPSSIGVYPYLPRFTKARNLSAGSIGLASCSGARLRTLPLISGYLGADIISAALAADLSHAPPGTMLVDVGTNGEIIIVTEKGLAATSCATGPAFEGATIRHGMQATSGAIDAVRFVPNTGCLEYTVIQRGTGPPRPPAGICGSGVISAVAELLKAGVIRHTGNFNPACGSPGLRPGEKGIIEMLIAPAEATGTGQAITLTQADVRAVQLAKGALLAGIDLLCRENGMTRPRRILLAGAFGSTIKRADALQIGMFPEMAVADIEVVGNAAGAGAVLALLQEELFEQAGVLANATRVLDLASHPDFQRTFVNALSF
jgi:uncharacterized 2Fe-2S/4Fe-4S cluster protein (DUF4445 family)